MKEVVKQENQGVILQPDLDISGLIKLALEKDVTVVEKLLEVRRELKKERAKELFYQDLSALQSSLPKIVKDQKAKNPDGTTRYSYASYDTISRAIQPLLKEFGFSYRFETEFDSNSVIVSCIITHVAGHSETTKFKAPVDASMRATEIQKWGASLSYAKRYSLSLALGLATEEDTDAVEEEKQNGFQEPQPQQLQELASDAQKKAIYAILLKAGTQKDEIHQAVSQHIGRKITSLNELSKKEAHILIESLQKEATDEPF